MLSPDERWQINFPEGGERDLEVRPSSGGDWTHLGKTTGLPIFTPDSKAILYPGADPDGKSGLYRVPPTGGQPVRLGDLPPDGSSPTISPDGRHIAVSLPARNTSELWMMENLVSAVHP